MKKTQIFPVLPANSPVTCWCGHVDAAHELLISAVRNGEGQPAGYTGEIVTGRICTRGCCCWETVSRILG